MHEQLLKVAIRIEATIVASIRTAATLVALSSASTASVAGTPKLLPVDARTISMHVNALVSNERDAYIQQTFKNALLRHCDAAATLSGESANQAFRALSSLNFYAPNGEMLTCLRALFDRLEQSGTGGAWHANALADALIQGRRFVEAKDFAQRNSVEIDLPPHIVTRQLPISIWQLSANGLSLSQVGPRKVETYIVGIVHPNCGFSRKALEHVAHDAALFSAFSKEALLLLPADRQLATNAVKQWNAGHSNLQMAYINQESDWDFVQEWETPQFFLIHKGRVMRHVVGWKPESTPQQLSGLVSDLHDLAAHRN